MCRPRGTLDSRLCVPTAEAVGYDVSSHREGLVRGHTGAPASERMRQQSEKQIPRRAEAPPRDDKK